MRVTNRISDDLILAILDLRRRKMPSQVAKALGVTREQVIQICAEVRDSDIKISTKKNVETVYEILLHYPHR